jgi:hypothetical protein
LRIEAPGSGECTLTPFFDLGRSVEANAAETKLQQLLAAPLEGDDAELDGFRDYLNELIAEEKGILPARIEPQ